MIETIDLPEMIAIGVLVEAPWNELPRAVPAAWTRLFETDTGATSFLEVSLSREGGGLSRTGRLSRRKKDRGARRHDPDRHSGAALPPAAP